MKHTLHIMRGLPGSGKSTEARKIAKSYNNNYMGRPIWESTIARICSTDDFFLDCNGQYVFNPSLIANAHDWCRQKVERAMIERIGLIILDNTNTQYWEFADYVLMAKKYNYRVHTQMVGGIDISDVDGYAVRNSHNVPIDVIKAMAERFEV